MSNIPIITDKYSLSDENASFTNGKITKCRFLIKNGFPAECPLPMPVPLQSPSGKIEMIKPFCTDACMGFLHAIKKNEEGNDVKGFICGFNRNQMFLILEETESKIAKI